MKGKGATSIRKRMTSKNNDEIKNIKIQKI